MSDGSWRKGHELEERIANLFRRNGYYVQTNVGRRDHYGNPHEIDVLATKNDVETIIIAIECKNHKQSIGIEDVRNFRQKLRDLGIRKGIFVSTSGFTEGALKYGKDHGLDMWDEEKIERERSLTASRTRDLTIERKVPYVRSTNSKQRGGYNKPFAVISILGVLIMSIALAVVSAYNHSAEHSTSIEEIHQVQMNLIPTKSSENTKLSNPVNHTPSTGDITAQQYMYIVNSKLRILNYTPCFEDINPLRTINMTTHGIHYNDYTNELTLFIQRIPCANDIKPQTKIQNGTLLYTCTLTNVVGHRIPIVDKGWTSYYDLYHAPCSLEPSADEPFPHQVILYSPVLIPKRQGG